MKLQNGHVDLKKGEISILGELSLQLESHQVEFEMNIIMAFSFDLLFVLFFFALSDLKVILSVIFIWKNDARGSRWKCF